MLDITTIQTYPVSSTLLKELQQSNNLLKEENKTFKTILAGLLIIGGLYIGYRIIKKRRSLKDEDFE